MCLIRLHYFILEPHGFSPVDIKQNLVTAMLPFTPRFPGFNGPNSETMHRKVFP